MANGMNNDTHPQENRKFDPLLSSLYPEVIYSYNKALIPSWKSEQLGYHGGKKVVYFTTSFFSSHTRTFHWVSIAPDLWNPDDTIAIDAIHKLTEELRLWYWAKEMPDEKIGKEDRQVAWHALLKDLPQGRLFDVARSSIEAVIQHKGQFFNNSEAQRTMLGLYSGHHHPADKNVEGIFYRFLSRCGNRCQPANGDLDYLLGKLTNGPAGNTAPPFAWFQPERECKNCKMPAPLKAWENVRDPEASQDVEPVTCDVSRSPAQELIELFFMGLLGSPTNFSNELAKRPFTALVPIYDIWIGNRGYGGIKAVILNFFEDEKEERSKWLENNFPLLRKVLPAIADKIAATGETMAVSQAISPPYDLLHQFLKILTFVQDWESASVVDTSTSKIEYRFYRLRNKDVNNKWDWKCEENPKGEVGAPLKEVRQDGARWFMWWTTDLWSEDLIPGIGGEELGRFGSLAIRFEFPDACHIPPKDSDRSLLRQMYIMQQLSLMRVLLPKVRARRAALRSAVSAIMGRNMSHNIGSHVIARYASKARNDRHETGRDDADHRGDFLTYLQRRMDFLAEVATSDKAFWSQSLALREQVNRLNYAVQKKRFETLANEDRCPIDDNCEHFLSPKAKTDQGDIPPNNDEVETPRPILLSFITGKESLLASVEYGKPGESCYPGDAKPPEDCCLGYKTVPPPGDHVFFACPGGEVGAHALYVILENVIRNSARHGGESRDTVRVFVSVVDDTDNNDYLQVELIDPRTKLTKNGVLITRKENDSEAIAQNNELAERKTSSLPDGNGKRIGLHSLPKNINSILRDEPFLDDAGSPNPNYWGVREMQICAHYLLNSEISDLEGVQPPEVPVLEADVRPLAKDEWCLMYRFRLQRPKLLAAAVQDADRFKDKANYLRSKGVVVLAAPQLDDSEAGGGWYALSEAVQDYGFLVVEDGVKLPEEGTPPRVALPVRTFSMKGDELASLIDSACSNLPSQWMEGLHERVAKQYQNKRKDSWANKSLFGIVLGRNKLPKRGLLPQTPPKNGGLFWEKSAKGFIDEDGVEHNAYPVGPLPLSLRHWHETLSNHSVAAIWVDHPGELDFKDESARLALASENPQAGADGPMWTSAEGAFSDSLHMAYLNELCGAESQASDSAQQSSSAGHELLAAALSRVVILDERVQSELNRDTRSGLPLSNMWPLMGVWVPKRPKVSATEGASPPTCDLDTPCFNAVQKFLKEPARRSDQYPIDFLVIHLTILERLKVNNRLSLPELLKQLKAGTQAEDAEVIIVTGRGVPSMARRADDEHLKTARFLPISALLECLVLRPSKLALMRVLWSAGRPRNYDYS